MIIVRPQQTRLKNLRKRRENPERQEYVHLMGKGTGSGDAATADTRVPQASEHERQAVAKAIGLPDNIARLEALASQSGGRGNSKERRGSMKSMATESDDSSDEEGGISLSRLSSTKSNLSVGDVGDTAYEAKGGCFEDMPNFIPGADSSQHAEGQGGGFRRQGEAVGEKRGDVT